jgi:hypothetical protein
MSLGFFIFFSGVGVWTQDVILAKQAFYCISSSFCSSYFRNGVLWTVYPDWPWISIFLMISASQVASIYRHEPPVPAKFAFLTLFPTREFSWNKPEILNNTFKDILKQMSHLTIFPFRLYYRYLRLFMLSTLNYFSILNSDFVW